MAKVVEKVVEKVEAPQEKATPWVSSKVVDEIPAQSRRDRVSKYLELLESVPAEGALMIEFKDRKEATQKAATIRGLIKRHELTDKYGVAARGANVYIGLVVNMPK